MEKRVFIILSTILLFFLVACSDGASKNNLSVSENSPVWAFVDYFYAEDFPWGEAIEKEVAEFMPDIKFKWTESEFIAIKDDIETAIITGTTVWNVFVTDLNGDGKPEFCATTSFGFGIVDNRVFIVDYTNSNHYEIADRMEYDYRLSIEDEKLIITQTPYPYSHPNSEDSLTGTLSIENDQLIVSYTNGETKTIEITEPS